jgi:hypothetical protein
MISAKLIALVGKYGRVTGKNGQTAWSISLTCAAF